MNILKRIWAWVRRLTGTRPCERCGRPGTLVYTRGSARMQNGVLVIRPGGGDAEWLCRACVPKPPPADGIIRLPADY